MARLEPELRWGKAKLLIDAVPKKNGQPQTSAKLDRTGVTLGRIMDRSNKEVHIQSAYLILLKGWFKAVEQTISRGVKVKLATNSMASNNHLTAFVGYRKQRQRMLETGAELYEMRPDAKSERELFTDEQIAKYKPTFGLHAKTMVFDRKVTFVGSFNLDPRSVDLNSEMGFLVESPSLAEAVAASIENDIAPGNSWQVIMQGDGQIAWITNENGLVNTETETEPMTSKGRRAEAKLLSVVPDKSQL
jgi:phosphatidylserine/phosphatidylglycerophosphate/cardiolipin synthase-like enzyme